MISTLEATKSKFSNGPQREDTRAASRELGDSAAKAKQGSDNAKVFFTKLLEALRIQSEITPLSSDERVVPSQAEDSCPNSNSTAC